MDDDKEQVELEQKVADLKKRVIAESTKRSYQSKKIAFIEYLFRRRPDVVSPEFYSEIANVNAKTRKKLITEKVKASSEPSPLQFHSISRNDIDCFVASLKKADGSNVKPSTYKTARSALMDLYRSYNCIVPEDVRLSLGVLTKAINREDAERKGEGKTSMQTGKKPMEFGLYCSLAENMLKSGKKADITAHLFLLLGWNLMARVGNVAMICLDHLGFTADSLTVLFAHMKNDKEGDRAAYARHCYANPVVPQISILLSLGIYFICFPFQEGQTKLFPGDNQATRSVVLVLCCGFVLSTSLLCLLIRDVWLQIS